MNRYNTIIFDMDGTLLDTLQDLADSVNYALIKHGYPVKTLGDIKKFVGNGMERLMTLSVPGGQNNKNFTNCFQYFKKHYQFNMQNKTTPYTGILELLSILHKNDYKLAVVSNKKDKAVKELTRNNFGEYITISIGERDNINRKPSPDSVYMALNELGSIKEKVIYVGDSEVDVQTARNAGILSVGVTWGFRDRILLESEVPDFIIDHPWELLDVLKNLNNT